MSDLPRVLLIALALTAACSSDATAPIVKPPSELHFLRAGPGTPALVDSTVSFWAKKGTDREVRMLFQDAGGGDGNEFLRLRVDAEALYKRPDGTLFAVGDSILITISPADPVRFIVNFQPAGLQFNPDHKAELRLDYGDADKDYNEDGVVNAQDTTVVRQFSLWRREPPDSQWVKNGGLVSEELSEVEGEIGGFSNYAIAY